jgi:signal transduction histidine kinase
VKRLQIPPLVAVPLALGIVVSIAIAAYAELAYRRLEQANREMSVALEMQATLHATLAQIVGAEGGQRGYLLTGRREYLQPYEAAVPAIGQSISALRELLVKQGTPQQREIVGRFNNLVGKKLAEMEATLDLYEKQGASAAQTLTETGIGQRAMTAIRDEVDQLSATHRRQFEEAASRWSNDVRFARFGMQAMTLVTVVLLLVLWALVRRDMRAREQRSLTLQQEQQRLESLVDERTAALTELSNYLQTVREEERAKLARDIHDELGGILVSAKMDVNWAEERVRRADTAAAAKLERALKTLDDGVQIKRRIIEELRPTLLDNLGLSAALEWQLHEICDRAGLACEIATPEDDSAIPPTVSIALFRILQEALTNVLKYARASRVSVDLAVADGSVMLVIEDDGIGIQDNAHSNRLSHGISGMRQRVRALRGEFSIRRRREGGTMIEVHVPLVAPAPGLPDATPGSAAS